MAGPRKDLTGQTFGDLTVLGLHGKNQHNQYSWDCQCTCGNIIPVFGYQLLSGSPVSCGCKRKSSKLRKYGFPAQLTGEVFGNLSVLRVDEITPPDPYRHWIVRCTCGKEFSVSVHRLVGGHKKSCGGLDCSRQRGRELTAPLRQTKDGNRRLISALITEEDYIKLLSLVDQMDKSVSYFLRQAVSQYVKEHYAEQ